MSKYIYEVYEVSKEVFNKTTIGAPYKGGQIADGIGGLDNELLLIVGYEIGEDEDG